MLLSPWDRAPLQRVRNLGKALLEGGRPGNGPSRMGEQGQSRAQQGWLGCGWGWWQRGGFWACLEGGQCLVPLVSHWCQAQRLPGAPWGVSLSHLQWRCPEQECRRLTCRSGRPGLHGPAHRLEAESRACSGRHVEAVLGSDADLSVCSCYLPCLLTASVWHRHQDPVRNAASRPRHPHHTAASLARSITYTVGKRSGELIEAGEDAPPRGTGAAIGTLVKAPSPCPLHWGPWAGSRPLPMATVVCQAPGLALLAGSQCSAGVPAGT